MRTPVILFLLLLLCGAPASAFAQGAEWEALNKEVISVYQKGQYDRALVVAKKALDVAEKAVGPEHPPVATSLAEPLYKRSLAIREKALGPDHPDVAQSLVNLAALYRKTGRGSHP